MKKQAQGDGDFARLFAKLKANDKRRVIAIIKALLAGPDQTPVKPPRHPIIFLK